MIGTSEGDVFKLKDFPRCFFSRKYRNSHFVVWNLRYDSGALLQILPKTKLQELRLTGKTEHRGYKFSAIGYKYLGIRGKGTNFSIWDAYGFYESGLQQAAETYLGKSKIEIETKRFTREYVRKNWQELSEYCIQDAILARDLMRVLINHFEGFDVPVRKLYSTAYISWSYFRANCKYVHVKNFWDKRPQILQYALASYSGGKFEVTRKGPGYYYEYDIVSAYPYEIANLIDFNDARVLFEARYHADADYGFLDCAIAVPKNVSNPVAIKPGGVCIYPSGVIRKVITKTEYEYFITQKCEIEILNAYWLFSREKRKPYFATINHLMRSKDLYKQQGDKLRYRTVKIFLNSLYGKFVQCIDTEQGKKAGASWNPIFASVITANCRVRITEKQQEFNSIVAVHTDSIISTIPLKIPVGSGLGEFEKSTEGSGIVLGCGVYQIGEKSKFRGFPTKTPLLELLPDKGKECEIIKNTPYSWREIAARDKSVKDINRFVDKHRFLDLRFDSKRLWLNDYEDFSEVRKRVVESSPLFFLS